MGQQDLNAVAGALGNLSIGFDAVTDAYNTSHRTAVADAGAAAPDRLDRPPV
ncbi:hypothetical protein [Streptomyces sp. NPDC046870]|uniref:hypothetical protein n=1 Tax=Streptomyces sp. NPDC046870 TaxID=3155135 RepID=UPI0034573560